VSDSGSAGIAVTSTAGSADQAGSASQATQIKSQIISC
jgi:hypothetical protein